MYLGLLVLGFVFTAVKLEACLGREFFQFLNKVSAFPVHWPVNLYAIEQNRRLEEITSSIDLSVIEK